MTTTVTKTVNSAGGGGGFDYSSWASWAAASPADLTSVDQIWQGYGTGSTVPTTSTTISGVTTSPTQYMEMTGPSPFVLAPKLQFDVNMGAVIICQSDYTSGIIFNVQHFRMSNIAIRIAQSAGGGNCLNANYGATGVCTVDRCIFESNRAAAVAIYGSGQKMNNCLAVMRRSGFTGAGADIKNGAQATHCTIVAPASLGTAPSFAVIGLYTTSSLKSCALFGFGALSSGTAPTYNSCFNDLGSPPAGVTQLTYDTSLFANITDGVHDYRLPLGSALIDACSPDSNGALDIMGTARPQGYTGLYDGGCWEYVPLTPFNQVFYLRA